MIVGTIQIENNATTGLMIKNEEIHVSDLSKGKKKDPIYPYIAVHPT